MKLRSNSNNNGKKTGWYVCPPLPLMKKLGGYIYKLQASACMDGIYQLCFLYVYIYINIFIRVNSLLHAMVIPIRSLSIGQYHIKVIIVNVLSNMGRRICPMNITHFCLVPVYFVETINVKIIRAWSSAPFLDMVARLVKGTMGHVKHALFLSHPLVLYM